MNSITCHELSELMASNSLYAVFDVRERGEYNARQISSATSLPRSQIEFRIDQLVPNRTIPLVVYDEGGQRAALAARTLSDLGYRNILILDGGLAAWERDGGPSATGVNVPSKAFGEKVQLDQAVPDISPEELKRLVDGGADLVILDVRTPEEFGRFCIPGGLNVPGGDLILWAEALKQKPETKVIVNCAGRTRSIIGAAALTRLGLTNVLELRNGTMGWVLAGFELETKPDRRGLLAPAESRERARMLAAQLAEEEKISSVAVEEIPEILNLNSSSGTTYLIDVRSEKEFATGHIAASINVPGGQAVQRADDFIAVKSGRTIFISEFSARAVMAAYWYRQMGFPNVSVLQGGLDAWRASGRPLLDRGSDQEPLGFEAAEREAWFVSADILRHGIEGKAYLILDVSTSLEFERAHIPGARWISRGWIDIKLPEWFPERGRQIVLTCRDGKHSVFAARALAALGYRDISVLDGGLDDWMALEYSTESGLGDCLVPPNDVVVSPSITGDREAMRRYLDWEVQLKH